MNHSWKNRALLGVLGLGCLCLPLAGAQEPAHEAPAKDAERSPLFEPPTKHEAKAQPVETSPEPELADPKHEALPGEPGSAPAELLGLPPALIDNGAALANSNLTVHAHTGHQAALEERYQSQLQTAVQQRKNRIYNLAVNSCTALLNSPAPDEYKRGALLELALVAEAQEHWTRAIQIYAQYQRRFPDHATIPEIYLRQGLLYRKLGAPTLALSKFYAVLSTSINLKSGSVEYFQRLVLQAQLEIADTYFTQGKLADAADFFSRLLKQEAPGLNEPEARYKLIRCYAGMQRHEDTVTQARLFLEEHTGSKAEAEVRFLLAGALAQLGQKNEALEQALRIMQTQQSQAEALPSDWAYWQQRTGNQIANQLYEEGDFLSALMLYSKLAELNSAPAWQLPVRYQIGLVYEKLQQPEKAAATYNQILASQKDLAKEPGPGLQTVLEMAKWRADFLNWQIEAQAGSSRPRPTDTQKKADPPLSALP